MFAFAEFVAENNAAFALQHKAFSVFALQTLLQKTIMQRFFAYVSIITESPQTFSVQGLSADGVKWTRTIDPHDVNVIL